MRTYSLVSTEQSSCTESRNLKGAYEEKEKGRGERVEVSERRREREGRNDGVAKIISPQWDERNDHSFHSFYPDREELDLSHLRPAHPAARHNHVQYRHSVLHDSLLSGNSTLAVLISDLTVHTVQLLRDLRQKLASAYTLPEEDSGSGSNITDISRSSSSSSSSSSGSSAVLMLSGYYGTTTELSHSLLPFFLP